MQVGEEFASKKIIMTEYRIEKHTSEEWIVVGLSPDTKLRTPIIRCNTEWAAQMILKWCQQAESRSYEKLEALCKKLVAACEAAHLPLSEWYNFFAKDGINLGSMKSALMTVDAALAEAKKLEAEHGKEA